MFSARSTHSPASLAIAVRPVMAGPYCFSALASVGEWAAPAQQGAIPEALRQASVRRSSGLSTAVPLPRGHASSRNHALVDGTFRVSVREPEREIVRWGPGRAWGAFLANGSIAATGRAAPGRRPPRISSDGLQTAGRRADRPRTAITRAKAQFWDGRHCGRWDDIDLTAGRLARA